MKLNREVILILALFFFALAMVGWDFNETAIHSNDCKMPVMDSNANTYGLTDIYRIGEWYYSIGDFMIYIGKCLFIIFGAVYLGMIIREDSKIRR